MIFKTSYQLGKCFIIGGVDNLVDKMTKKHKLQSDMVIANVFETKIKMAARDAEWKKAAEVLNNYSLIFHVLAVMLTFGIVFLDDLILSNKL